MLADRCLPLAEEDDWTHLQGSDKGQSSLGKLRKTSNPVRVRNSV